VETVRIGAPVVVESLPCDPKLRGAGRFGVLGGHPRLDEGDRSELESGMEEVAPAIMKLASRSIEAV
jgi:hypothetical protein